MSRTVDAANASLATDFYELTMAEAYVARGMHYDATFELYVRHLPRTRRFLIAAGLDEVLTFLEEWRFEQNAIAYLASLGMFSAEFLDHLARLRFAGDVWAMPEGEVAFENEPLVRVTAPLPQAQLVETFLLSTIGFQTMIASKAARIGLAAASRAFIDFSPRRDHGPGAGLGVARAAYIGGAAATSMTLAGMLYGIPVTGTMAHSYVMTFDSEHEAFTAFARRFPDNATLLIDTYDTEEGARIAVRVADELAAEGITISGVRLDSGDLVRLSFAVRRILDKGGHPGIKIFASGDLDENRIAEMVAQGCPVDAFGVGTRLGTSSDAPYLGVVYKLVSDVHGPKSKLSADKATLPGPKQVFRIADGGVLSHDVLARADETIAKGRPLLHRVMAGGKRTGDPEPFSRIRDRRAAAVAGLPPRLRGLQGEERPYVVEVSRGLGELAAKVRAELD